MRTAAFVSLLANQRNGTLDTGSTTNLARRVWEHRAGAVPGFTRDDGVTLLVWYEGYPDVAQARQREHTLKRWRRVWKLALIEAMNPQGHESDLAGSSLGPQRLIQSPVDHFGLSGRDGPPLLFGRGLG